MNEEIMNNEVTMEEATDLVDIDTCGSKELNVGSIVIKVAAGVGIGAIALAIAKRKSIANWFTQRKIKSLEKEGYVVAKAQPDSCDEVCEEVCEAEIIEE